MQARRKYEGVIFDMDGTLIVPLLDFNIIRSDLGIPGGEGILETVAKMPASERTVADARLRTHELAAAGKARSMPGASEIISAIRSAGMKIALLTRNSRQSVKIVLERLPALRFDLIMSREDGAIKPEPDGVLEASRQLDIAPALTVCVGDYHYDIIAANAAGAVSVLLTTHPDRPNCPVQPDYQIGRLDELKDILGLYSNLQNE